LLHSTSNNSYHKCLYSVVICYTGDASKLPEEYLQPWCVPTEDTHTLEKVDADTNIVLPDRKPLAPITYGSLKKWESMKETRQFLEKVATHEELKKSQKTFPEIKKGQVLLVKTDEREWWFGTCLSKDLGARDRDSSVPAEKIKVQWMLPYYPAPLAKWTEQGIDPQSRAPMSDMNVGFRPWFKPNVPGQLVKNEKNTGEFGRDCVRLIINPAKFVYKNGFLTIQTKIAIHSLACGFSWAGDNRQQCKYLLTYTEPELDYGAVVKQPKKVEVLEEEESSEDELILDL
jgi:hypothetical protein